MKALVLGAGGFIGNNMVKRLVQQGVSVTAADIKLPEFESSAAHQFVLLDLRDQSSIEKIFSQAYDEVYHFAADMGGAGYVFTGEHDAAIMYNSLQIDLNIAEGFRKSRSKVLFFASSACVYPLYNQMDKDHPICEENSVYPANPDSEYGWGKLMTERLFLNYARNYNLNIRIARLHNIYGEGNPFDGGKEKAPAAVTRKVLRAVGGEIEIWGDGEQTRTFLYIEDCLDAIQLLVRSNLQEPVNIGSEELVSINELAYMVAKINEKEIQLRHINGPVGVSGRCSHNKMIEEKLNWKPRYSLEQGMRRLNEWIKFQLSNYEE